ncbi:MAG: flagellar hook capping FlgD N-terminal domain-containing protein [Clostridiales bacterium]|nr:flagellar hook capping protein [Roseburia sp.]MDD7637068.1 flagellar hook capping FlgD N-terminal domain-containing protein [Clostridiales bacterium]MDY4112412.1 flagellar hook capping FlgD N-terminal domain-containing protein [Roseburia sp.]
MALVQAVEDGKIVSNTSSSEDTKASNNDLGYDQFLQLLCAEMQYQDPLEPTSNTEYVAQLATFSQMEAMLNMQNSIESSNANALVGKYVIVKTTSTSTGETTAVAGFVDYVQYENGKQYLSINGSLYSIDDLYEVADTEYMEAVALGEAFTASVAKLPDADKLTLAWKEDVENLSTVYDSFSSYQKSYISKDTLTKFQELVATMKELVANSSENTEETDESTDTDDTMTTE